MLNKIKCSCMGCEHLKWEKKKTKGVKYYCGTDDCPMERDE